MPTYISLSPWGANTPVMNYACDEFTGGIGKDLLVNMNTVPLTQFSDATLVGDALGTVDP
jgi:hypothetical protein